MGGHEPPLSPLLPCHGGGTTHAPGTPDGLPGAHCLADPLSPRQARRLPRASWPVVAASPSLAPNPSAVQQDVVSASQSCKLRLVSATIGKSSMAEFQLLDLCESIVCEALRIACAVQSVSLMSYYLLPPFQNLNP